MAERNSTTPINLIGQRFGRLVVLNEATPARRITKTGTAPTRRWSCLCDCGRSVIVHQSNLTGVRGNSRGCGCYRRELTAKRNFIHGKAKTPEHKAWVTMIQRCDNPKNRKYPLYGGRGIRVCERWRHSFSAFLDDVGLRPSHRYSIDRIDNDGNYEPDNVKWSTALEQQNNKSSNVLLCYEGLTLTLSEWSRRLGIKVPTLHQRLAHGWTIQDAFERPVRVSSRWG